VQYHILLKKSNPDLQILPIPVVTVDQMAKLENLIELYVDLVAKKNFYPRRSFLCNMCSFTEECEKELGPLMDIVL
jgi:hypothetical protein